jgi:hypothetical protein
MAILVVDNAPGREIRMHFEVEDLGGHFRLPSELFNVDIADPTVPGTATRPEDIRGRLAHG